MSFKSKLQTILNTLGLTSFGVVPSASMINLGYHSKPIVQRTVAEDTKYNFDVNEIKRKLNNWKTNKEEIMNFYKGKKWKVKLSQKGDWFGRQNRISNKYTMPEQNSEHWNKRFKDIEARKIKPSNLSKIIKEINSQEIFMEKCAKWTIKRANENYNFLKKYCWVKV